MSGFETGTRTPATAARTVGVESRRFDRSYTRDLGMSKLVLNQPVVFSGAAATLAGAFGAFVANDQILVEGTSSNNGFFTVIAAAAGALTLAPPPTPESPASCTVRAV